MVRGSHEYWTLNLHKTCDFSRATKQIALRHHAEVHLVNFVMDLLYCHYLNVRKKLCLNAPIQHLWSKEIKQHFFISDEYATLSSMWMVTGLVAPIICLHQAQVFRKRT